MSAIPSGAPASRGLFDALRALRATLAEVLQVRGALFAVELGEEVERRRGMLVLAVIGATFLHLALVLLSLLVAVAFWETHRVVALGAMTLLYAGFGMLAFWMLHARIAGSPRPFTATLAELERDLAQVRGSP